MAVRTVISKNEIQELLKQFSLGLLLDHTPIEEGMQNTNYRVQTEKGHFVLTLFEDEGDDYLGFTRDLLAFGRSAGLPVPEVVVNDQGHFLSKLLGKDCWLTRLLPGKVILVPSPLQCKEVGCMLARFHEVCQDFNTSRVNLRHPNFHFDIYQGLVDEQVLTAEQQLAADPVWRERNMVKSNNLPHGLIHGDYFRDNVLLQDSKVSAVLDLSFAGKDVFVMDLAHAINDWACHEWGALHWERFSAFLAGYVSHRPLTDGECEVLPGLMALKALEIWANRTSVRHRFGPELVRLKPPEEYWNLFTHRMMEQEGISDMLRNLQKS